MPVHITEDGKAEARLLVLELAHAPFDLCLHTRFGRAQETAELALAGRDDGAAERIEMLTPRG